MKAPRILVLCCGAGGSSTGYARAGFRVTGIDIRPQPNFPFDFVRADALTFPLAGFDFYHASPPCQRFTNQSSWNPAAQARFPNLIDALRRRFRRAGKPYVIENVPGAPLINPTRLCGTSFGLGTRRFDLRRHRLFETNWKLAVPPACQHSKPTIGVYGGRAADHSRWYSEAQVVLGARPGRHPWPAQLNGPDSLRLGSEAMGIDWMTWRELREAIPPAFTEWIGRQARRIL